MRCGDRYKQQRHEQPKASPRPKLAVLKNARAGPLPTMSLTFCLALYDCRLRLRRQEHIIGSAPELWSDRMRTAQLSCPFKEEPNEPYCARAGSGAGRRPPRRLDMQPLRCSAATSISKRERYGCDKHASCSVVGRTARRAGVSAAIDGAQHIRAAACSLIL